MIVRVLRNILDNAVKFTDNGLIEIKVKEGKGRDTGFAIIEVKDTGIGILPQQLELIFQEFRQASEGIGRNFEGSGLGLTIAKNLTELMGGRIKVSSEINKGSVFTIMLPIIPNHESNVGIKAPNMGSLLEILIVDDDDFAAELMRSFLAKVASVYWVKDENSAIRLIDKQKFDMVFLDINLGIGGSGVTIAKHIRQKADLKDLPVIAVTGYTDQSEVIDQDEDVYFNKYLTKPFKRNMILSLVAEYTRI